MGNDQNSFCLTIWEEKKIVWNSDLHFQVEKEFEKWGIFIET